MVASRLPSLSGFPMDVRLALLKAVRSKFTLGYGTAAVLVSVGMATLQVVLGQSPARSDVSDALLRALSICPVLLFLLGAALGAGDLRNGMIGPLLVARPSRVRWVAAQTLATMALGMFVFAVAVAMSCAGVWLLAAGSQGHGGHLELLPLAARLLPAAGFVAGAAAVGALSAIAAGDHVAVSVMALVWYFVLEVLLASAVPQSKAFLPGTLVETAFGIAGPGGGASGWGVVGAAYLCLAAAVAVSRFTLRDVRA
jgi:hypothetical protein